MDDIHVILWDVYHLEFGWWEIEPCRPIDWWEIEHYPDSWVTNSIMNCRDHRAYAITTSINRHVSPHLNFSLLHNLCILTVCMLHLKCGIINLTLHWKKRQYSWTHSWSKTVILFDAIILAVWSFIGFENCLPILCQAYNYIALSLRFIYTVLS